MALRPLASLCYQDLNVGDEWESAARTITVAEISLYAGLSGDFNALHVDHDSAGKGPFGGPIAHGLLGLAIASGLGTNAPRVETLAFTEIVSWVFKAPIVPGDTIRVRSKIDALEPRPHGRRATVTWIRRVLNQRDEVVQEGITRTIVRGRPDRNAIETTDPPNPSNES